MTRQREAFLVLMESYEKALYLEEAALNSAGYATQKLDIYLTGIDARMQDLTNTWKEFGKELVSSDFVKFFISLGKTALNAIRGFVNLFNSGFGKVILSITALIATFTIFRKTLSAVMAIKNKIVGFFSGLTKSTVKATQATMLKAQADYQEAMASQVATYADKKQAQAAYELAAAQNTAAAAAMALNIALGAIALVATVVVAVITAVRSAEEKAKQKHEEYVESLKTQYNEIIDSIEQTQNQISSLESLAKQLEETGGSVEAMRDLQDELSEALGRGVDLTDQQRNNYEALSKEILFNIALQKKLLAADKERKKENAKQQAEANRPSYKTSFKVGLGLGGAGTSTIEGDVARMTDAEYEEFLKEAQGLTGASKKQIRAIKKAREEYRFRTDEAYYSNAIAEIDKQIAQSTDEAMISTLSSQRNKLISQRAKDREKEETAMKPWIEAAMPLAQVYAEEFKEQAGGSVSAAIDTLLEDTIAKAIMYAKTTTEREEIFEAISQPLLDLDAMISEYSLKPTQEGYEVISETINELIKDYPQLTRTLTDLLDVSYEWIATVPKTVYGITELRGAINLEIKDLKKLEEQYKSLADAEQSYLDIKKNILKQLENLTLEEQRAVLGYTIDITTGEMTKVAPDYSVIEDNETIKILREIDELYNQYQADITGLTDEQLLQNTELTNEYNRQLKMLEKQFAINQKNLEIQKAQIKLASAEAERNVRMFIGGQWIWTASPEAVATAQADVSKLEQEKNQAILDAETQEQVDNAIRLTEQMSSTISLWERLNQQMNDNLIRGDEAFGALVEQSYGLAGAFNAILNKVLSKEEFSTLKGELEGLIGKPLSFDTGGSLGSKKGYFLKDTSEEELILNPRNTTATKSLLNKLPELESIINKLVSGFLISSPQMASNLQGQGELGEVYNINNLNVTYSGKDILELLRQIKTKVPFGV